MKHTRTPRKVPFFVRARRQRPRRQYLSATLECRVMQMNNRAGLPAGLRLAELLTPSVIRDAKELDFGLLLSGLELSPETEPRLVRLGQRWAREDATLNPSR